MNALSQISVTSDFCKVQNSAKTNYYFILRILNFENHYDVQSIGNNNQIQIHKLGAFLYIHSVVE